MGSYTSLLTQKVSQLEFVATMTSETIEVNHQEFIDLYAKNSQWIHLGRAVAEHFFIEREKKELLLLKSPYERYRWLLENRPNLLKIVTFSDIANYLGMAPESLSRIRARMAKRISF